MHPAGAGFRPQATTSEGISCVAFWFPPSRWRLAGTAPMVLAQAPAAPRRPRCATTQLPRNVRPTHYDVAVVPHAESLTLRRQGHDRHRGAGADREHHAERARPGVRVGAAHAGGRQAATLRRAEGHASTPRRRPRPSPSRSRSRAGRYRLAMDYTGKIGTQANGLFALDYDTPGRQEARAVHPVRERRRAPLHPVVGRAGLQGDLHARGHRAAAQMAVSNMPVVAAHGRSATA